MPNVMFQMIVFNGERHLEAVLDTLLPFGDVYVTEGPVTYYQSLGFTQSTDRTLEILHDRLPEDQIVSGQWKEKDEMMNAIKIPDDTEYVWMFDADELMHPRDIQRMFNLLNIAKPPSVSFKAWSFFGGFNRYMTGFEEEFEVHRIQRWYPGAGWATHRPPTVLDPQSRKPWRECQGHMSHEYTDAIGIRFFHYSFVWPLQMYEKALYYHDRSAQMTIPNYFRNVWLPWVLGGDLEKQKIEDAFKGVHDWKPKYRGDCFTKVFEGDHPKVIEDDMLNLQYKWRGELEEVVRRINECPQ